MKTLNINKLCKSIASVLPFLYVLLAFGGLLSNHNMHIYWHIVFAIAEAILVVIIGYHEEDNVHVPTAQQIAQAKYGWGQ